MIQTLWRSALRRWFGVSVRLRSHLTAPAIAFAMHSSASHRLNSHITASHGPSQETSSNRESAWQRELRKLLRDPQPATPSACLTSRLVTKSRWCITRSVDIFLQAGPSRSCISRIVRGGGHHVDLLHLGDSCHDIQGKRAFCISSSLHELLQEETPSFDCFWHGQL